MKNAPNERRCIRCGRPIPDGSICLGCSGENDMQTFSRKTLTNGDRIRSMTDQQLIPIVMHYVCTLFPAECPSSSCDDCVRMWLSKEAAK